MAKGYWIGRVDVHNDEGYKAYAAANPAIFKKFGGALLSCAAASSTAWRATPLAQRRDRIRRTTRPRWPAINSPEYQANIKLRQPHSIADLSSSKAMTARSPRSAQADRTAWASVAGKPAPAIGQ